MTRDDAGSPGDALVGPAADSTTYGTVGLRSVAELSDVDVLVTDSGLPADAQRLLKHRLETAHVVSPAGERVAT